MRKLEIYSNGIFAGLLTETDNRKYIFWYDDCYLGSDEPPVSLTLPKRKGDFLSDYLFPFFASLLPEGANKRMICRNNHIDEKDAMGLLTFFSGKEFIGSISVKTINETTP